MLDNEGIQAGSLGKTQATPWLILSCVCRYLNNTETHGHLSDIRSIDQDAKGLS